LPSPDQNASARWLHDKEPGGLRLFLGLLALLQALLIVSQAWLLAGIVDSVLLGGATLSGLGSLPVLLLLVFLARPVTDCVSSGLAIDAAARIGRRLRPELFARIAAAGPALADRRGAGALAITLIEQVDSLERWYAGFLPRRVAAAVGVPVVAAAVLWQDWLAGLFLLLAAPLIPLFMMLVGWGAERASHEQQHSLVRLGGAFQDRLRGLDTIRRFGSEDQELARMSGMIESFRQRTLSVLRMAFLSTAVLEFFSAAAIAAVAIYVGLGLLGYIGFGPAGQLTLHTGLFVLLLAPEFFLPLRQLSQAWHDRAESMAAAADLRVLDQTPAARPEPERPIRPPSAQACRLDITDLVFHHAGRGRILDRLSLHVAPGERVLVRGVSGCGKSTLLDLIAGFMRPTEGHIRIDKLDLDRIAARDLVALRGWMGQQGGLFDGSLLDNVRLSHPDAEPDAVLAALAAAGLAATVRRMPGGLMTPLRASGEGLSGGEARRVLLARALLRPRPLLLLDEPTASLDAATSAELWQTLSSLSRQAGPTIVCASHDPQADDWADTVYTLVDGRLRGPTP